MQTGRIVLLASLYSALVACGWNTRFDDDEYRALGQTPPGNAHLVTRESATPVRPSQEAYEADRVPLQDQAGTTLRYGHPETIHKIIQTAEIHCVPQTLETTGNQASLTSCFYQFPAFCGSHAFTVVRSPMQTALVYHDTAESRNIVDIVNDRHLSQPGLWDVDDRLSVAVRNPAAAWKQTFGENNWRGWEVDLTEADRHKFGTRYARAVNQTLSCF